MKIYTKSGDQGETSLFSGERVKKSHIIINSYGTVDELNSWIGLIKDNFKGEENSFLISVQEKLFLIGSHLSAINNKKMLDKLPKLNSEIVLELEKEIDKIQSVLPEMKNFILPGGNTLSSYCHIARCVCRRAERLTIQINQIQETNPLIIKFLNRLSDYLFVLSRKVLFDLNIEETPWIPRKVNK